MHRTITAQTLKEYLSSAHTPVMLCRAHADNFALSSEDILDAEWQIDFHITELEALRGEIRSRKVAPRQVDMMTRVAAVGRAG